MRWVRMPDRTSASSNGVELCGQGGGHGLHPRQACECVAHRERDEGKGEDQGEARS
jgi:hypothetical protein